MGAKRGNESTKFYCHDRWGCLSEALVVEGVDKIFGLPGIQLDPVFDALYRNGEEISLVTARHEQAVTYMADGYSRRSHRPGVGIVVPGPGFLNSTAGLATAYACGSKVLLIVGQISSDLVGLGRGRCMSYLTSSGSSNAFPDGHTASKIQTKLLSLCGQLSSTLRVIQVLQCSKYRQTS